jgi:hypothetical protein
MDMTVIRLGVIQEMDDAHRVWPCCSLRRISEFHGWEKFDRLPQLVAPATLLGGEDVVIEIFNFFGATHNVKIATHLFRTGFGHA